MKETYVMKATVVVDNIENNGLKGEWGLCHFIEYHQKTIVLDVGASNLFVTNADKLGLKWRDADYAVLSHAHYDHANGMKAFFEENPKTKFYIRDTCQENCYFKKWAVKRYIGIPRGVLTEYEDRIVYASGEYQIDEGIYLIPHKTEHLDSIGRREMMYVHDGNRWRPDDFSHEQSLVFDTPKGLVIFNSCSHGGADNIIREVSEVFRDRKVYALIGGFHLHNKSRQMVIEFAKRVKETGISHIYTGHCTGDKAYRILHDELGDMVEQFRTGMVMEF